MIYLVDASVYIFRAYYSIPPHLTAADGTLVNAVFGFVSFLGELLERTHAEHIVVAFDASLTTSFRNQIYPAYKANRELPPAELEQQFELCREAVHHLGVAEFAHQAYEADDIIGTIAAAMRTRGHRAVIVTRDKDLAQCLRAGDQYWDYARDRRLDYVDIEPYFGARPERMADYQALTGDSVDNIPGVPGVGPKTAAVLMREFDSLEALYDNLERVPHLGFRGAARMAERLAAHREEAFLARRLTTIACDAPIDFVAPAARRRPPAVAELFALYDRLEFGTRLRRQAERLVADCPAPVSRPRGSS